MITVNAMGDACPIPVIKTKKAMQKVTDAETIEVLVDNEIAVQNVTKMAQSSGGTVTSEKLAEKEFKVTIQLSGTVAKDTEAAPVSPPASSKAISSSKALLVPELSSRETTKISASSPPTSLQFVIFPE